MEHRVPHDWARRGAVEDLITLVSVYAQMKPAAQGALWAEATHVLDAQRGRTVRTDDRSSALSIDRPEGQADTGHSTWDRAGHLVARIRGLEKLPLSSSATEIILLMTVYAELPASEPGDWSLLVEAARGLASQRLADLSIEPGAVTDVDDWLTELAGDTYPHGEDAARLLGLMSDHFLDADEVIFTDGMLDVVLCGWEGEHPGGERLHHGYKYALSTLGPWQSPPLPEEFFGIAVSASEFTRFDGDEPVVDRTAWQAEVDLQCVERFAGMVARWRSDFFSALLSGKHSALSAQAKAREEAETLEAAQARASTEQAAPSKWSEIDVDRLLDEVFAESENGAKPPRKAIPGMEHIWDEIAAVAASMDSDDQTDQSTPSDLSAGKLPRD